MTLKNTNTKKGKAAVCYELGTPMDIVEYPLPDVGPDDMLVKITMACICGSDLHFQKKEYVQGFSPTKEKPWIMGHEMTGRIYKMGKNVKTDFLGNPLKEGDRIVYSYFAPCGKCWACLNGSGACPNRNRLRGSCSEYPYFRGAYAEYYYLLPDYWTFKVPDELPDESVASANCALSTVTSGLNKIGIPFEGKVVIQGAGGLGISAAAVAKEMGAAQVIIIDRLAHRLELAKSFGADFTIDLNDYPMAEDRIDKVNRITGGTGADVVVEVVGYPEVIAEGIDMLRIDGKYLTMGLVTGGMTSKIDIAKLVRGQKTIMGSCPYDAWTLPSALEFLLRNKDRFPFHKLISHTFSLEDINTAFKEAMAGNVSRAAIVP